MKAIDEDASKEYYPRELEDVHEYQFEHIVSALIKKGSKYYVETNPVAFYNTDHGIRYFEIQVKYHKDPFIITMQ